MLRLSYFFFYVRLRTTPEETGYGYSRILSESIIGALELILVLFAVLVACIFPAFTLVTWLRGRAKRRSARPDRREPFKKLLLGSLLAATVAVLAGMPALAWWQGGLAARQGQTVRNVYFRAIPHLPVLSVQAVPAYVSWIDGGEDPIGVSQRMCLMYLGQASDIAVFYDFRTRESLRFPVGSIVVSLRDVDILPRECLPASDD